MTARSFWVIYFILSSVMNGYGVSLHQKRCPNDNLPTEYELIVSLVLFPIILPTMIVWAATGGQLQPCSPNRGEKL